MVPDESEHKYLTRILRDLGYKRTTNSGWSREGDLFIFDLFQGNKIHTTELLESPLEPKNHKIYKKFSQLYIGILNEYDLIVSKLFRGSQVDFDDCLMLMHAGKNDINIERLAGHYNKLASYDISEARLNENPAYFFELLKREGIYG